MDPIIKKIIAAGCFAPSGDNSQPWQFGLSGNSLTLVNLPDKDLPFYNVGQRGSFIGHGAVIENMAIAAAHFGYGMLIDLFPEGSNSNMVARMTFTQIEPVSQSLYSFIFERRTNRKPYKNVSLTEQQRAGLLGCAGDLSNSGRILLAEATEAKKALGLAASVNEIILFENPILHHHFFANLVWTEEQERSQQSGLYLKTLELPPPAVAAFRLFRSWGVMRWLNRVRFPRFIAHQNSQLYSRCSAIAAVIVAENDPQQFVGVGRVVERLWLTAASLGLECQPLAGTLFLMQRIWAGEQLSELSLSHRGMIQSAYEQMRAALGITGGTIAFLLRIGQAQPPSARSSKKAPVMVNVV